MHSIAEFEYEAEQEESLISAMKYSLEVTQKIALPILDGVTTLKACVEYYRIMGSSILNICGEDGLGGADENEGLINFKAYSVDEYIQAQNEAAEYWDRYCLNEMEKGRMSPDFYEKNKEDSKKIRLGRIERFKKIRNAPETYAKVMAEMERRKAENIEKLKRYGLIREST